MSGIVKNYESLIGGFEVTGITVTTFTSILDGTAGRQNTNESWDAKRAGAGNSSWYDAAATGMRMSSSTGDESNPWRTFRPSMVLFDTSAIGSSTIISATFQIALNNKTDDFSDSVTLVNATPASTSALVNADWQQYGTTKQTADKTIASFTVDGSYNTMALNSTGLAAIDKTGITKYGLNFTSIVDNNEPDWISDGVTVLSVHGTPGGINPPQLVVTHTSPAGNADTHTKGSGADVQIFTTTGSRTWVKPSWVTTVYIEVIGGGGGGGGGVATGSASGGGGGAMARGVYDANALPATLTVAVGATGAKGYSDFGGTLSDGTAGGTSSVTGSGFTLSAYGGGGGSRGTNGEYRGGGGGGGTATAGGTVSESVTGGNGGDPDIQGSTQGDSLGGRGGKGGTGSNGYSAEFGGGGGGIGGATNSKQATKGGASIYGAGGGGGGLGNPGSNNEAGFWSSYTPGEGILGASGDGISRSYGCGDGGSGANASSAHGRDGGAPGGGGGGGSYHSSEGGNGGVGARGEVRIFSW